MARAKKTDRCSQDNLIGPAPVNRSGRELIFDSTVKAKPKGKLTTFKMTKQEQNLVICAAHINHYLLAAIQARVFTASKGRAIHLMTRVDEQISHTLKGLDDYLKTLSKP
jgi:hypothetical protein